MVNYENGKIYKLYSPTKNIVYYGSTAEKYLSRRFHKHLAHYKRYKNGKIGYTTSFDVLECEDYKIELLEEVSCNNVEQLRERERYYIENNECVNKNIPNQTQKEWRNNNEDYRKSYEKKWRENNKDHIIDHRKEKVICECGCEITRGNLSTHKKSPKHINLIIK